jgi:hypothetical protein
MEYEGGNLIKVAQCRDQLGSCKHGGEPPGSVNIGNFLTS